ncbi:MAG TPA: glycosyltransferase family 2 protein [Methanotrichaceae archaeon]|nr:glycosyltransferase family 2 protein [Methanotrichaceae archaeon]
MGLGLSVSAPAYHEVLVCTESCVAGRELSVVIPAYNEEGNIADLYHDLHAVLASLGCDYEILFIDDGSTDGTFHALKEIRQKDNRIKIIRLRRNFGKSVALNIAFKYAKGDIVITMDGDLQDDPSEIPRFIKKLEEDYDLVSGWKYDRKDPLTKRLPSRIFNELSSKITGVKIHDFNCGFKAYRRDFLKSICLYGEMHRYIPALAQWHGFRVAEIKVVHHPRRSGRSKYGFSRIFKGFLDLITVKFLIGYSTRPLHVFGIPGITSLSAGLCIGLYLVMLKYIDGIALGGRPLLLLSILLIFIGLQFLSIGLLGEMIAAQGAKRDTADAYVKEII